MSIKPRMTADIVSDVLTMAWFRTKPGPGLVHHSDRGSQYASHAFQARLKECGMVCCMSRKGNCSDNAPTESFFNSLKNARVHGTRYSTRAAAWCYNSLAEILLPCLSDGSFDGIRGDTSQHALM